MATFEDKRDRSTDMVQGAAKVERGWRELEPVFFHDRTADLMRQPGAGKALLHAITKVSDSHFCSVGNIAGRFDARIDTVRMQRDDQVRGFGAGQFEEGAGL